MKIHNISFCIQSEYKHPKTNFIPWIATITMTKFRLFKILIITNDLDK